MRRRVPSWLLALAAAAIVALCLVMAPRPGAFGGTDSAVTALLRERGVVPWFRPLLEPAGPEVESGLFALQAAVGAGVGGYALGYLRGRQKPRP